MPIRVDPDFTVRTIQDLVRIDSVNPSLVTGAAGEAAIAAHVAGVLETLGCDVARHEPLQGRVSVVGTVKGTGEGRSLMLNAHHDTVGVDGMDDPFAGALVDGRVYGRGAYDMKGSLAACLAAVKALKDANVRLNGDLLVAAVADEEAASIGTADVIRRHRVDGAIVTEPTSLAICLAHKGFVWIELETRGRAAHGSRPELGVDANLGMGLVLAELARMERALRERPAHPLVGPPSLHAATLHGGTGWSTYSDRCVLGVERRSIPGETESAVLSEFRELIDRARAHDPDLVVEARTVITREPFETSRDAPLTRALRAAYTGAFDADPRFVGDSPWMDAALLAAAGIDTVVIGPHGEGAHAREEWVDVESVITLAGVLAETAREYCGEWQEGAPEAPRPG